MMPFTYRALDLLADHEPRFAAFPKIWADQIQNSDNQELLGTYNAFQWAMVADSLAALNPSLTDEDFRNKLSEPSDRDKAVGKTLGDLGINTTANITILAYFAGRRNILDDERAWIRFTNLVQEEVDIRAC